MKKKKASLGKKVIIGLIVVILLLAAAGTAGILYLNHYLNSPEFITQIQREAREQVGIDLELGSIKASILKGFVVDKIVISSPVQGEPPVLTVKEVLLKYSLGDLLQKKLTISKILIDEPRLRLKRNSEGRWDIPGAARPKKEEELTTGPKKKEKKEETPEEQISPWKFSIDSLQVRDGSAELITGREYDPVRVEELNISARLLRLTEPREIDGRLEIGKISIKGEVMARDLSAGFHLHGLEELSASIEVEVARGRLAGSITADLKKKETIPYRAHLDLRELDIAILMEPFLKREGEQTKVTGKIYGKVEARGEVVVPDSLKAQGDLDIKEGSVTGNSVQNMIAGLMNDDERIRKITFDQAEADLGFERGVLTIKRLIIHSHKVIISTGGTVDLTRDQEMDLMVGISFRNDLVDDIKPRELRRAFRPSPEYNDYQVFNFKVWGPPSDLKNDFAASFIQQGLSSWLRDELLKKDRKKEEDESLSDEERKKKEEKRKKKEERIERGMDAIFKLFEK